MNILITGGAGFIGSHVADELIKNNHKIIVVDDLSSGNLKNLDKNIVFYELSILSEKLEDVFKSHPIDFIFHFVAQVSVAASIKDPLKDANINIIGSLKLIELAKKYSVKKFFTISTAAVYGTPEYLPVDENHSTKVLSPYGLSKLAMEKYLELSGLDYLIMRFSNVYGPRQTAHGEAGVVSIFADKIKNQQNLTIYGDGNQIRDFIFVKDIAKICSILLSSDFNNEILNVSSNTKTTVNELAKHLLTISNSIDSNDAKIIYESERVGDIKDSILDNSKLLSKIDFDFTPIETGLMEVL